jgi:hypothetical protein
MLSWSNSKMENHRVKTLQKETQNKYLEFLLS